MKRLLVIAYLGAVLFNGLISCATPWWPRADRAIPFLDRILQISSPIILLAAVFGWVQPRRPLALGSGAYAAAVLLGLAIAVVTVQKNPDLTQEITIQQLFQRFPWYGPVYIALAILQIAGAGLALRLWLAPTLIE